MYIGFDLVLIGYMCITTDNQQAIIYNSEEDEFSEIDQEYYIIYALIDLSSYKLNWCHFCSQVSMVLGMTPQLCLLNVF
jgi:hypothetical protein